MSRVLSVIAGLTLCLSSLANETTTDTRISTILALDSDEDYGEYLASECSTCHNATSDTDGIPIIHGKDQSELINALLEFKDKKRNNETMQSVAGALDDEQMGALALYFSSQ